jgi:hypothetical protein
MSDEIIITLEQGTKVYIDIEQHPLAKKWFKHFEDLLATNAVLEKNYCFMGYPESPRNGDFICTEIMKCVNQINKFFDGKYHIDKIFSMETLYDHKKDIYQQVNQDHLNWLHRYFEELQGVATPGHEGDQLSTYFYQADDYTKLCIRRLNLLCHEFESWARSYHNELVNPNWVRPSQLMCYLHSPRFELEDEDFDAFGIQTLYRDCGGVYLGVNKAIGKTHYEVFHDEQGSGISDLTTIAMRTQTLAAGDFDIEWACSITEQTGTRMIKWKKDELARFEEWLRKNGFDPADKKLGIGTPKIGQVNLMKSFETTNWKEIRKLMVPQLNVISIETTNYSVKYQYNWTDENFDAAQIQKLYH